MARYNLPSLKSKATNCCGAVSSISLRRRPGSTAGSNCRRNPGGNAIGDFIHLVFRNRGDDGALLVNGSRAQRANLLSCQQAVQRNRWLQRPLVRASAILGRLSALYHALDSRSRHRIFGQSLPSRRDRPDHLRIRIGALGIGLRETQRFEWRQPLRQLRILRDALRVKLKVDPFFDAHLANHFDVSRPRPERQPVERVEHLLVLRKFGTTRAQEQQGLKPMQKPRMPSASHLITTRGGQEG